MSTRKIVVQTSPVCPDLARRMNLQGMVKLLVTVAPDGSVKSVEIRGGHPLLANAAETAVHEWRWTSAAAESKEVVEMRFQRK
ncbi:MAG: energy transducer TonB [Candidatus Sulfotelmatobacter sp.]